MKEKFFIEKLERKREEEGRLGEFFVETPLLSIFCEMLF